MFIIPLQLLLKLSLFKYMFRNVIFNTTLTSIKFCRAEYWTRAVRQAQVYQNG